MRTDGNTFIVPSKSVRGQICHAPFSLPHVLFYIFNRKAVLTPCSLKANSATYSKDGFRDPFAVLPEPSLELLNFSTGVNSTPESEVVLVFSSMIIPSDDERLCFEVAGLLAGRGKTLDKFSELPTSWFFARADSEPTS